MGVQEAVSNAKTDSEREIRDQLSTDDELTESLKVLIERDNPMADAAAKALELL